MADTDVAQWWNLQARFEEAERQVQDVLARLQAHADTARRSPEMIGSYTALMQRAASLQASIASSLQTIRNALDWLRGLTEWVPGLNGLGIAPVIGIAAIAAALAAVTKFITDALSVIRQLDAKRALFDAQAAEQRRLEAQGMTPQEAAAVVNRSAQTAVSVNAGGGLSSMVDGIMQPLVIGGVIFLVARYALQRLGSR